MLDITYPPVIAAAKTWFRLEGMKFQMSGVENIPKKGGALIASNHIGYVDFVFNGLPAERRGRLVRFMAKKEAFEGAVGIAAEAGVPLIPMALWGTQLLKTKDHPSDLWARGKTIAISVGEPIEVTGKDPAAETALLRTAIANLLDKVIADYPLSPEGQ